MKSAETVSLTKGLAIRLISAPCFLATRIEAFQSGARGDFLTSHDLEDIVEEVQTAEPAVRTFLAGNFQSYLESEHFLEALEGLLAPDAASQARRRFIHSRMAQIRSII